MTIGQMGGGKTVLLCTLINLLLTFGYEERNVALYQAPKSLLKAIQKAVPDHLKSKFRIIERLHEIQPFDIFAMDEGILTANALEALTKNAQYFIESLIAARQMSVLSLLNTQDDGILRKYRTKAQFKFYKSLTDGYIEETFTDKFARKHQEILATLDPKYTLFRISHPWFSTKYPRIRTGYLYLPLRKYCPWFNDEISRYFEGENFDSALRKTRRIKERAESVIQLLASKFESKITIEVARGFLWDNYPMLLNEFEGHLKYIVNAIKSRYKLNQLERLKYSGDGDANDDEFDESESATVARVLNVYIPEMTRTTSFPDFLINFYRINLKHLSAAEREYHSLIMFDWANGLSQADIRENRGGSPATINTIIKKYRSGEKLVNDHFRIAFILEYYIALFTDARRLGGNHEPDLMYYQNFNALGPGEVKLVQTKSNRVRFYIYSRNSNHHALNPSFEYCLNHGLKRFPLFYYWPKWGQIPMMIPVMLPEGGSQYEYSFFVEKQDYEEYSLNFLTFNKFTFFLSPS